MKNPFNLPKQKFSYSQMSLWLKNKEGYRAKYYRGEPQHETAEMIFGKLIAKRLEDNDPALSFIPRYEKSEQGIEINLEGLPIIGYLDSFDPSKNKFREYKTSHLGRDGKLPWNRVLVAKHDQLPFYSFLIEQKYGEVDPMCHLDWIETDWKKKTIEFQGMTLTGDTRELLLTGNIKTFPRRIAKWERKRIKDLIIKTAEEISKDYKSYQQSVLR